MAAENREVSFFERVASSGSENVGRQSSGTVGLETEHDGQGTGSRFPPEMVPGWSSAPRRDYKLGDAPG